MVVFPPMTVVTVVKVDAGPVAEALCVELAAAEEDTELGTQTLAGRVKLPLVLLPPDDEP
jgi:hypothetical protein